MSYVYKQLFIFQQIGSNLRISCRLLLGVVKIYHRKVIYKKLKNIKIINKIIHLCTLKNTKSNFASTLHLGDISFERMRRNETRNRLQAILQRNFSDRLERKR